jgi:hypothetical protein
MRKSWDAAALAPKDVSICKLSKDTQLPDLNGLHKCRNYNTKNENLTLKRSKHEIKKPARTVMLKEFLD